MARPIGRVAGLRATGQPSTYIVVCWPSLTTATCHHGLRASSWPQLVTRPGWLSGAAAHWRSGSVGEGEGGERLFRVVLRSCPRRRRVPRRLRIRPQAWCAGVPVGGELEERLDGVAGPERLGVERRVRRPYADTRRCSGGLPPSNSQAAVARAGRGGGSADQVRASAGLPGTATRGEVVAVAGQVADAQCGVGRGAVAVPARRSASTRPCRAPAAATAGRGRAGGHRARSRRSARRSRSATVNRSGGAAQFDLAALQLVEVLRRPGRGSTARSSRRRWCSGPGRSGRGGSSPLPP